MKFEVLKKNNIKRNVIIGALIVAIISACILTFTRAKYKTTESIPLVRGTINYSLADLNIIGLYIDGEEVTQLDEEMTYTLDTSKSSCTYKDGSTIENLILNYDSNTKTFSISPYTTKGTKCTLYFNSTPGITTATLSYSATTVNNTSNPNLTVDAKYESITYSIASGSSYASIDEETGVVTGKSDGTAIVEAVIIDKKGNNIIAVSPITIGSISNTNRYIWNRYKVKTKKEFVVDYYSSIFTYKTTNTSWIAKVYGTDSMSDNVDDTTWNYVEKVEGSLNGLVYGVQTNYTFIKLEITGLSWSNLYFYNPNKTWIQIYNNNSLNVSGNNVASANISTTTEKGDLESKASHISSSAYPTNAVSGSYWYTYQGNDLIDPNSVTLTLSENKVIATVNARSNSYGGTISYQYEYSTNGGKTWEIATTTSNASYNIAIPSNAKSIIVRVKAKDNYGFTSNTYLYSNGISIIN